MAARQKQQKEHEIQTKALANFRPAQPGPERQQLDVSKNMTDKFPHPYTAADASAFIDFANSQQPVHIFAIDIGGEAVGGIGVHPQTDIHCKNAELGYWLAEAFWGKGIISAAIRQAVDFAFATYDIDRVFARPFGTNLASQRALE
ncbi:GNAT family N-acetyltransferase [Pontibacter toksunensis]|uniref:GNAT family N-acetyltransferase n=1 Tax=Pontibacter toksunensis TaxID=1332631 RepID=UPI003670438C